MRIGRIIKWNDLLVQAVSILKKNSDFDQVQTKI